MIEIKSAKLIEDLQLLNVVGGNAINIGQNIKAYRLTANLSREELGNILNLSMSTIARYEEGNREPSLDTLFHLSKVFDTSMEDLIMPK